MAPPGTQRKALWPSGPPVRGRGRAGLPGAEGAEGGAGLGGPRGPRPWGLSERARKESEGTGVHSSGATASPGRAGALPGTSRTPGKLGAVGEAGRGPCVDWGGVAGYRLEPPELPREPCSGLLGTSTARTAASATPVALPAPRGAVHRGGPVAEETALREGGARRVSTADAPGLGPGEGGGAAGARVGPQQQARAAPGAWDLQWLGTRLSCTPSPAGSSGTAASSIPARLAASAGILGGARRGARRQELQELERLGWARASEPAELCPGLHCPGPQGVLSHGASFCPGIGSHLSAEVADTWRVGTPLPSLTASHLRPSTPRNRGAPTAPRPEAPRPEEQPRVAERAW
nr:PREDICTED: collagen alpha-2(I) chain-like [Rhinolophus sinicus]